MDNYARKFTAYLVISLIILVVLEISGYIFLCHFAEADTSERYLPYERLQNCNIEPRYIPHPYLGYENNSDYDKNAHNSLGFRGPEIEPKDNETYRIALVGGSSTYTSEVEDWRDWAIYRERSTIKL